MNRLIGFARVENLVEEFDHFFRAERDDAHPAADESLLHDADALFELRAVLFKCFVLFCFLDLGGFFSEEAADRFFAADDCRRIRNDDEKAFRHDVGIFRKLPDEFDIFARLDFEQIAGHFLVAVFENRKIGPDVEAAGFDEDLHRKVY